MGRPLRILLPDLVFHVLNRGNNRQEVFKESEDYDYYLSLLDRYKKEFKFKLYHFCLMPNHTHFLIEPTIHGTLPKVMQRITLAQTWFFNKKYNQGGHVWQGRYKSSLVDKDEYFMHCSFYIEGNPIRAGLVEKPEDWKWSSYRLYTHGEENSLLKGLIDIDPFYLELDDNSNKRQEMYQNYFNGLMNEHLLRNVRAGLSQGVFGRPEFQEEAKERFKIASFRPRGRPKKEKK